MIGTNLKLEDTTPLMSSKDYKERFKAEYYQTKIRYEKLKTFNTKLEAADLTSDNVSFKVAMPAHNCPIQLLRDQQRVMGEYLNLLEVRAIIEGIEL